MAGDIGGESVDDCRAVIFGSIPPEHYRIATLRRIAERLRAADSTDFDSDSHHDDLESISEFIIAEDDLCGGFFLSQ